MSEFPNELESLELPIPANVGGGAKPPVSTAPHESFDEHRNERQRRLKLAVVSSILTRPLALIIPILVVYLFADSLGKARYGLYEAIGSFVMFLGMTNLGLTMGLMNKLTDCSVTGDRELARRYTSSLFYWLLGAMIVCLAAWTIAVPLIAWQKVFPIDDPVGAKETPLAVWVAGVCMLLGLVISLPGSVYSAYQEMHRNNIWEGAAKVATLIGCFVAARMHGGVVAVLLAVSGAATLVRFINIIALFAYEKPWLRPKFRDFEWKLLKATVSQGILLFVLQLSNLLLFSLDKQIISTAKGVAEVSSYAVIGRFFVAGNGVYMMLLMPLWPATGEAVRRGDIAWVKKSLRWSLLIGWSIALGVGGVLFFAGPWIMHFLAGGSGIESSRSIVLALTATLMLRSWVDARSITLNSIGVIIPQIIFYAGHAVLNVIVAIAVVHRFGVVGVAWSTPITALVTSTWGYPWMMKKYVFSREKQVVA